MFVTKNRGLKRVVTLWEDVARTSSVVRNDVVALAEKDDD